jgi:hypothetical protein
MNCKPSLGTLIALKPNEFSYATTGAAVIKKWQHLDDSFKCDLILLNRRLKINK